MLQIFDANSVRAEPAPLNVSDQTAVADQQTLARQLHAETEKRFFLEEAIDLLDLETTEDSSSLINVLNLLNRTANTKQILIVDREGQLIHSSFCLGQYQPDLSIGTITWLIDQAIGESSQRVTQSRISLVRLAIDQETLTMPILGRGEVKAWLIATGNSKVRCLKDQRALFESARRLLERLIVQFD